MNESNQNLDELSIWENIRRYGMPGEPHAIFESLVGEWKGERSENGSATRRLGARGEWIMDRRFLRLEIAGDDDDPAGESVWILGFDIIQQSYTLHAIWPGGALTRHNGRHDHASKQLIFTADSTPDAEGLSFTLVSPQGFEAQCAITGRSWRFAQGTWTRAPRDRPPSAPGPCDELAQLAGAWQGTARRLFGLGGRVIESQTVMNASFSPHNETLSMRFHSPFDEFYYETAFLLASSPDATMRRGLQIDNFNTGAIDIDGRWDGVAQRFQFEGEWSNYLSGRREPVRIAFILNTPGVLLMVMSAPDHEGHFTRLLNMALRRDAK